MNILREAARKKAAKYKVGDTVNLPLGITPHRRKPILPGEYKIVKIGEPSSIAIGGGMLKGFTTIIVIQSVTDAMNEREVYSNELNDATNPVYVRAKIAGKKAAEENFKTGLAKLSEGRPLTKSEGLALISKIRMLSASDPDDEEDD